MTLLLHAIMIAIAARPPTNAPTKPINTAVGANGKIAGQSTAGLEFGIIGGRAMQEYFKKESSLLVSAIDTALMREGLKQAVREYEQLERT